MENLEKIASLGLAVHPRFEPVGRFVGDEQTPGQHPNVAGGRGVRLGVAVARI